MPKTDGVSREGVQFEKQIGATLAMLAARDIDLPTAASLVQENLDELRRAITLHSLEGKEKRCAWTLSFEVANHAFYEIGCNPNRKLEMLDGYTYCPFCSGKITSVDAKGGGE